MSEIFYTADPHFNHKNIIRLCNRPFKNMEEMNETLVENWNKRVTQKDTVYVIGDFAWGPHNPFLRRLNGKKHLILGNHDKGAYKATEWDSINNYLEVFHSNERPKTILFHYGMRVWNRMFHGSLHLYGHSHGRLPGFKTPNGAACCDVGVDVWDYQPVTMEEIEKRIEKLPMFNFDNIETGKTGFEN